MSTAGPSSWGLVDSGGHLREPPGGGPSVVPEVLDTALGSRPDAEAVVARSGRLTYCELNRYADGAALMLRSRGVGSGTVLAVSLPNDLDIVVLFHGAMRAGAIWLGINANLTRQEVAYILADAGAAVLIADRGAVAARAAAAEVGGGDQVRVIELADGWMQAAASPVPQSRVRPTDPAAIAYTSGTTGFPKGVVHSHRNLLIPGAATVAHRGYGPDLRRGDCLPLTILNMVVLSTLLCAQAGGTTVIMDRIEARSVTDWIRRERVTSFTTVPTVLHDLIHDQSLDIASLDSLSEVITGGADCPVSVRERFRARFGYDLVGSYGLTEAPTIVTIEVPGVPHDPGSSGRALPDLSVTVRDEAGAVLAPGETGEICVGPTGAGEWSGVYSPMLGYLGRPEETRQALRDGVLHTGDVGHLTVEGELKVTDRLSSMIIRGGANVYPAEVERILHRHDGVEACVVVGIPDERLGERVGAIVQPAAGRAADGLVAELRAMCGDALARYKVPEVVVLVDGLPRNAMDKIDRKRIVAERETYFAGIAAN